MKKPFATAGRIFASLAILLLPVVASGGAYGLTSRTPIGAFLNNALPASQPIFGAFDVVRAFPNLVFSDPTFLLAGPNTNRLYVGCRQGTIYFFTNNANTSNRTLFLDLSATTQGWDDCGLLGMAFHPSFGNPASTNRGYTYVYRNYSANPVTPVSGRLPPTTPSFNRLSRFTVPDGSLIANPNSELVLINQYDQHLYHNGGGMFFGADGFLYLSNGDEGGSNGQYDTAQKINGGLFGGVLRLDVNRNPAKSHPIRRQPRSTGLSTPPSYSGNYFIPNDNPWLDAGGSVLEEFWAIGLRSPHRMTFDSTNNQTWVGDVGEHTVEEVDLIKRGGNYQWAYQEGSFAGPIAPPSPLIGTNQPPVYDYLHEDANNCVIGGYVYRGTQFAAELGGKYIFGDNGSGRIWALTYNGTNAPATVTHIANMPAGFNYTGLGSFGLDQNKEIYMCQVGPNGAIWKLAHLGAQPPAPPKLLSQTGAFTNLATLATTSGLIPFEVNAPFWSDGADKRRWVSVPNDGAPYGTNEQVCFTTNGAWIFPAGTVFLKHFELATNETNLTLMRRLETRLLVCDTNGGVYGLTYKWRANNSDADLLTNGLLENIVITTASGTRTQTWQYPSRQDCLTCHNVNAKFILGPKTAQLNGDYFYPVAGVTDNQLRAWNHVGLLNPSLDEAAIPSLPALVNITNTNASLELRVRSYLDANCAQCHQPNGVQAYFDARFETPLTNQAIINGILIDTKEIPGAKVIVPTNLVKSIMRFRLNTQGVDKMPPLGRNVTDAKAVAVLDQWILSLPPTPDLPAPWRHQDVGSVGLSGDADYSDGNFKTLGSGADISGSADAFHFLHQSATGNVQIVARVKSLEYTDPWAKAGVMIRQSLDAYSRHVFMTLTPGNGENLQYRLNDYENATSSSGANNAAPYWVKLIRNVNQFSGYASPDGILWTLVGTISNAVSSSACVGLAVTSHDNSALNTANFDNVEILQLGSNAPPAELPSPWQHHDIGDVGLPGRAGHGTGRFAAVGAGQDIYNNADAFHFIHQDATGDVQIIARVVSLDPTDPWAKAGIMIRRTTNDFSGNVFLAVTPGNGVNYQHRQDDYINSSNFSGPTNADPYWLKLVRSGSSFVGYTAVDGLNWTLVAGSSNNMPATTKVGLAVTAHNRALLNTATFDNVAVSVPVLNHPPVLASIPNRTVHAGTLLNIPGSASDPDLPPDVLTFSLTAGAGLGASINPTSGVLTWQPGSAYVFTTNNFTIQVTDNGSPVLSASQSFTIAVWQSLRIQSINVTGQMVTVGWNAVPGAGYYLQANGALDALTWTNLPGGIIALGPLATKQDALDGRVRRFYRVILAP